MLDSAYSLNDRVFYEHFGTILIYAVIVSSLNDLMVTALIFIVIKLHSLLSLHFIIMND